MLHSFRPLDGESFSKHELIIPIFVEVYSFRPLDGESFSKLEYVNLIKEFGGKVRFRPLDGESFSKH